MEPLAKDTAWDSGACEEMDRFVMKMRSIASGDDRQSDWELHGVVDGDVNAVESGGEYAPEAYFEHRAGDDRVAGVGAEYEGWTTTGSEVMV